MRPYKGKVVLATFFYKHQAQVEYVDSLLATVLAFERMGMKFDCWLVAGNFHMEVCVNQTLTRLLNSDATDIVLVDSDESWNPESLIRLLLHEDEIVCGVYPLCDQKTRSYPVVIKSKEGSPIGKMLPDGNCLLEAERIPGGFMKISKTALQKWVNHNPDNWYYGGDDKVYAFFGNEVRDNTFHGMDFCFADSMKKAGVSLWVDPMCDVQHWGLVPFKGTYDAYLRAQKANQDASSAFAIVGQMAQEVEARRG